MRGRQDCKTCGCHRAQHLRGFGIQPGGCRRCGDERCARYVAGKPPLHVMTLKQDERRRHDLCPACTTGHHDHHLHHKCIEDVDPAPADHPCPCEVNRDKPPACSSRQGLQRQLETVVLA